MLLFPTGIWSPALRRIRHHPPSSWKAYRARGRWSAILWFLQSLRRQGCGPLVSGLWGLKVRSPMSTESRDQKLRVFDE